MNSFAPFSIARLPRIEYGRGVFSKVVKLVMGYGKHVLIVTGSSSFQTTSYWRSLISDLNAASVKYSHCKVLGEPSPHYIDAMVKDFADQGVDVVLGIGGGSVLDAAKAIAGLLKVNDSVMDYLEGVGPERTYQGPAIPFLAVPTTAGTGSEATKNAVLSVQGDNGFKKSFRDDKLVAEFAIVDPALLESCTPDLIASNGMDALTQLMESYVSLRANVMTDALAISGLRAARDSLLNWYKQGAAAKDAQDKMAYAALLSGITLAQVGLGSVHGLASPLGAFYPIPHGVVCGTLVAAATEVNIESMLAREPDNLALLKYARLGDVLTEKRHASAAQSRQALLDLLHEWTELMQLPRLQAYGVNQAELDKVVTHSRGSSMKTNPIVLSDEEVKKVLEMRL
ncbi:MAG: iron-containing alcohol dehydrogenase [Thioalkalispiraceae bacterium]|jgi:alcohol dehydrogenase